LPPVASGESAVDESGVPRRLGFELDDASVGAIKKAGSDFDSVVSTLELGTFETESFGKDLLKSKKVGTDGFMQMGFQLAHKRMKGYTPATYESASTAAFKHGRTETIRSATPEAAVASRGRM
jgi:carnitine O-palmitoyltransferase 2